MFFPYNKQRGISIIEIMVVIAIIAIAFTALLSLEFFYLKNSSVLKETTQANSFAQEAMEAIRNFRDGVSWNNDDPQNKYDGLGVITLGVDYHPEQSTDSPPKWMMVQGPETIDIFTRKIVITSVQRDGSGNIVSSGGTNDPDTKKITITVSWQSKNKSHAVELVAYLTNWRQ